VAAWTASTCPDPRDWAALGKPQTQLALARALAAEPLLPWARKWKLAPLVLDASLHELRVTTSQNPFYAMVAFGASFEACLDLGAPCSPQALAHAVVVDMIARNEGRAPAARIDLELARRGLSEVDVTRCKPFGAPQSTHGLPMLRERKCMQNDVVIQDGCYVRKRDLSSLARFVHSSFC
jgi:hypothetical protein